MDNMFSWVPGAVTGALALVGVMVAGWLQSRRDRDAANRQGRQPSPPSTQEVWSRLDHLERVLRSSVYLLGEVAEQWPHDSPPVLSRKHVAILSDEGYLPPEWEPKTN